MELCAGCQARLVEEGLDYLLVDARELAKIGPLC